MSDPKDRAPFIDIPGDLPGIRGLFAFKPETGAALSEFAQTLLRGTSPLTPGERETIAAYVSSRNETYFCTQSHAATAAVLVDGGRDVIDAVIEDVESAAIEPKLRALLRIADKVRRSGLEVTAEDVEDARAAGAKDEDIHDAVLVAAAFCMFNRYVDGLATVAPRERATYEQIGGMLATAGYVAAGVPPESAPGAGQSDQ
ncbi:MULTISPECIES: carboxymuconolactone decarboxylase family protein [Nocardia]|uniref:Carboxymuconolactone decarboxylase n=1 Tax=Nocardia sputorum TaxID=2984338 RepID=A0ABN6TYT8_9NOCA|nr:carboxymuconolactone decarboxylase family protein [Nocardia sputorum]BDT96361.1 carboxymuconolactone decarboxylase [Nocardia sputorum]BDT98116.1 carboxymuconolactone decarboxylase [Nocardia sputorum]